MLPFLLYYSGMMAGAKLVGPRPAPTHSPVAHISSQCNIHVICVDIRNWRLAFARLHKKELESLMEIEAMDDIPLVILFNKTDLKVFDVLRMSPANAPTNDAWCATSRTRSPIAHMLSSPRCPQRRSWTDCSWNQSWQRKKTSGHFGLLFFR